MEGLLMILFGTALVLVLDFFAIEHGADSRDGFRDSHTRDQRTEPAGPC